MRREVKTWWSRHLGKNMEIAIYGEKGFALLFFPTETADHLDYERFAFIQSMEPFIEAGKCKVYSVNSVNRESWFNSEMPPPEKSKLQLHYNEYLLHEVIPFIHQNSHMATPIIPAGVAMGAYHAVNSFLRRPDIFDGVLAMSGFYDIRKVTKGYFDDNCYFNSPADFLPNLKDEKILSKIRTKKHIYILSGQGAYENPAASVLLAEIFRQKRIPHVLDLWGSDMPHDWPTWKQMIKYVLESGFN